jgi:hypothetical protein
MKRALPAEQLVPVSRFGLIPNVRSKAVQQRCASAVPLAFAQARVGGKSSPEC